MKKLLIVLMLSAIGAALAQDNDDAWRHSVGPVFDAPFEGLLLPWPADAVQPASINACWADEEPPFLGTEWRFWCYTVPTGDAWSAGEELQAAFTDAGANAAMTLGSGTYTATAWVEYGTRWEPHENTSRTRYWVFKHNNQVLVSLATDAPE